ncbi:MAG: MFS transporter [Acidimicrobiia bacterium]|nr:MFS transporter [Acidimicrobiia bacterium]
MLVRRGRKQGSAPTREPLPPGFGSLWSVVALDILGFGLVLPILPLYAEDLGASGLLIGLLLGTYSLAQLVAAPILGRLSDRYGRRPVLIVALCGSSIGHVLTALAPTVWLVIAARAVDGFSGGSMGVAQAAVSDVAAPAQRPRLFGLLGAAVALGFVAGPALGSLAALGGPKLPFFCAAALTGLNALSAWWRLPETRPRADRGPSVAAGYASAAPAPAPAPAPARGAVAGFGSLWALLRGGGSLARLFGVTMLGGVAFSGFEATFSLLGRRRVGLTEASAGLVFAGVGIVLGVVQGMLVKRATGRFGAARTAQIGLVANVVAFGALVPAAGWAVLAPAIVGLTVGQGLLSPALSTSIAALAPEARRGEVFGAQQSVAAASRIVGPLAGLALFDVATGLPYVAGAILAAVAFGLLVSVASPADGAAGGSDGHPSPGASGPLVGASRPSS